MKRSFEIEWEDDCGPLWMNRDNLLLCLTHYCRNSKFTVRDVTNDGECDKNPNSSGPIGKQTLIESVRGAVARGWCDEKNEKKEMDVDLAEAIVREVIDII